MKLLWDEIQRYCHRYYGVTGHPPTAIPLTDQEMEELREYVFGNFTMIETKSDSVPMVMGMDIYFTENAKARRDQILKR